MISGIGGFAGLKSAGLLKASHELLNALINASIGTGMTIGVEFVRAIKEAYKSINRGIEEQRKLLPE